MTVNSRIAVGSDPYVSAIPPHTPAMTRFDLDLRRRDGPVEEKG
jgi:hypothetical protein